MDNLFSKGNVLFRVEYSITFHNVAVLSEKEVAFLKSSFEYARKHDTLYISPTRLQAIEQSLCPLDCAYYASLFAALRQHLQECPGGFELVIR